MEQQEFWFEPAGKRCSGCGARKPLDDFNRRRAAPDGRQSYCRSCNAQWHADNRARHNRMIHARLDRVRLDRAQRLLDYLREHPCVDCGEGDPVVLEFDHLRDKIKEVTALAQAGNSWQSVLDEIAKCEVVCANCHRRRTSMRRGSFRYRAGQSHDADDDAVDGGDDRVDG